MPGSCFSPLATYPWVSSPEDPTSIDTLGEGCPMQGGLIQGRLM
jgi:hypothetical protein